MSRKSVDQVSASRVLESRAKKHCVPFHWVGRRIWGCLKVTLKSRGISSPSPWHQDSEKHSQRIPTKHRKWSHASPAFNFCEKLLFVMPSIRKHFFTSPRHPNFDSKFNTKNGQETRANKIQPVNLNSQKALRVDFPNRPQIDKMSTPDLHVSLLLLPRSPRVPRGSKISHQSAKMEAPAKSQLVGTKND